MDFKRQYWKRLVLCAFWFLWLEQIISIGLVQPPPSHFLNFIRWYMVGSPLEIYCIQNPITEWEICFHNCNRRISKPSTYMSTKVASLWAVPKWSTKKNKLLFFTYAVIWGFNTWICQITIFHHHLFRICLELYPSIEESQIRIPCFEPTLDGNLDTPAIKLPRKFPANAGELVRR